MGLSRAYVRPLRILMMLKESIHLDVLHDDVRIDATASNMFLFICFILLYLHLLITQIRNRTFDFALKLL